MSKQVTILMLRICSK